MNWNIISLLLFYGFILLIYYKYKEKFTVESKVFIMYKSQLGVSLMDRIAKKFPRFFKYLAYLSVLTGFAGMGFILYFIVKETVKFLAVPGSAPPLSPVLPGIEIPGAPVLSFWHWIIALFIVAVVHEFSHGIYARLYGIKVKSSGFAFLGPILAAFVEPDDKQMASKPKFQQLAVLSAGPFSNILCGILFLLALSFVLTPVINYTFQADGLMVSGFIENYPMSKSGIMLPFLVTGINDAIVTDVDSFVAATNKFKPGDTVKVKTDKGDYDVQLASNPDEPSRGFLGITGFKQKYNIRESLSFLGKIPNALLWINLLFVWLFIISIGIGLFNLLPLGPVDGGKMFLVGITGLIKNESKAKRIFLAVTYFLLLLILINLLPWVMKLLAFLLKGFFFIVSLV